MTAVRSIIVPYNMVSDSARQVYFPKGMAAGDLLPRLASKNVVIAGGLHAAIKGPLRPFQI